MLLGYLVIAVSIFIIGGIDYVSGSDVHVVSLYFIPLAFAGRRLGRTGAIIASALSTVVWLAVLYADSGRVLSQYILLANFGTQGAAFLSVSMLVAMLSEALRKESANSRTDPLTGLKNRMAFVEQSSVAVSLCARYARPVALAYIDLDNFKNVNDSFGHECGDALLRNCGRVISESLRTTDISARLGGDEFVVFLPETNADNAVKLLESLRQRLEASTDFMSLGVTASIGIVIEEVAKSNIDELLRHADTCMYTAKRDGKNKVWKKIVRMGQLHD